VTTNNEQLIQLMEERQLNKYQIAQIIGVSDETVKAWRKTPGTVGHRKMSDMAMELLKIKLEKERERQG